MSDLKATVTRESPDRLSGETWVFIVPSWRTDGRLVLLLETYSKWTRKTPRHKPVVKDEREYRRLAGHHDMGWFTSCRHGRVWLPPTPDDVVAEARQAIAALILAAPLSAPTIEEATKLAAERRY